MANVRRLGFIPTRMPAGGTITYRKLRVLTNNTNAIFLNDSVKLASGAVVASASGTDEQLLIASVSGGVSYVDSTSKRIEAKYLPAATLYTSSTLWPDNASFCYVVDQADRVEFEANLTNGPVTLAHMNYNTPQILTAGSTTTGLSAFELNNTGIATTSTFPWRLREFVQRADNDPNLTDCKVICMINAGQTEPVTSAYTGS